MTKEDCIREIPQKDGSIKWHYEVRIKGLIRRGTEATKREAKAKRDQIRSDFRKGSQLQAGEAQRATVGDLIDKFTEHCLHRYGSYQPKMKAHLDWWKEEIGKIRLTNLNPGKIIECQNKLHGALTCRHTPRSSSTVNRYTASISSVFRHAVTIGWIQINPMIRVSKLKEGPSRTRFLSLEELEKLFEACENSSDQNLLPITKLAALTGMRMGEILGLKVGAVNWSQKVILLERTKNGDKRLIPITPAVEEVLNRCLDPSSLQDEFIFKTSRKNTKYRAGMIRLSFAKACKESGLTGIRLHDLRRTYCSWAGMSGCTQMELQEMLGHRSPHMTKIYLRYSKSHIASQMQRAQEKIMGGSNEND